MIEPAACPRRISKQAVNKMVSRADPAARTESILPRRITRQQNGDPARRMAEAPATSPSEDDEDDLAPEGRLKRSAFRFKARTARGRTRQNGPTGLRRRLGQWLRNETSRTPMASGRKIGRAGRRIGWADRRRRAGGGSRRCSVEGEGAWPRSTSGGKFNLLDDET